MDEDPAEVLTQEIDEETLSRMPTWLRKLREAHKERHMLKGLVK